MIPWFDLRPLELGYCSVNVPTCLAFAGATVALLVVHGRARATGLSSKRAVDGLFLALICALVLGHVFDVLLYRQAALHANWRVILPWYAGSCSLGALVGLALATVIAFRTPRGSVQWRYVDQLALAVMLGLGILRVGCFLGHHHAGRLSTFVLAVRYPKGARHDLGLYEALVALTLFVALLLFERTYQGRRPGLISGSALLFYGLARFVLEFLRADDIEIIGRHSDPRYASLTGVQYAALAMMGMGVWLLRSLCSLSRQSSRADT